MADTTESPWNYCGDMNLEYGGSFIDLSEFRHGYCNAVRVTDLDGGCGFTGASLIEHVVVSLGDYKRLREALRSCGRGGMGQSEAEAEAEAEALAFAVAVCTDGIPMPCSWGPEEKPFVDSIEEYREEPGPRLVYADWLEEHGHCLRAKFIRELTDPDFAAEGKALRWEVAEACLSYGFFDLDDSWANYTRSASEIVQCQPDGPIQFDGWRADKRITGTTLEAYVQSQHLDPY